MAEVLVGVFLILAFGWSIYQLFTILDFFREVPKHLKRIADALEGRTKDG